MTEIQPGWIAPGGQYQLANPPELGWVSVEKQRAEQLNSQLKPQEKHSFMYEEVSPPIPKLDTLSSLGRRILNEIKDRSKYE